MPSSYLFYLQKYELRIACLCSGVATGSGESVAPMRQSTRGAMYMIYIFIYKLTAFMFGLNSRDNRNSYF